MDLGVINEKIKSRNVAGCYILSGEEDYLKTYYLEELRKVAITDEAFAPFNLVSHDGAEVDFATLTDDVQAPPLMSDFKMIEWKYPSFEKMREGDFEELEKILDLIESYGNVILVFLVADGDIDLGMLPKKPSKLYKRFEKRINIWHFEKSTDAQLLSWLKRHFDAEGIKVSADALKALLFRSGHSMSVLEQEVVKLSCYLKARGEDLLTPAAVEEVASSTPECDTFALSNALLTRNKRAAFFALDEMKGRKLPPLLITGMMAKSYSELSNVCLLLNDGVNASDIESVTGIKGYPLKLYLSAARRFTPEGIGFIIEELTRMDSASKSGGVDGYTAVELFIAKYL